MFFTLVWVMGFAFILLEGKVLGRVLLHAGGVDLTIILIAYIYSHGSARQAGLFAFAQGLCVDIYSSGFEGLFVFLYLCGLGAISLCSKFIHLSNPRGQVFVTGVAWLVVKALFFAMLIALESNLQLEESISWSLSVPLLATAIMAPVFFYLLDRLSAFAAAVAPDDSLIHAD
ncbi:MAG: hypothetical protein DRH15_05540 [Deltaproteobacteria bacterium]|nr:MAG: hypothetical protein DRH15_05540 [Deltaproteobacteria bacterium]